MPDTTINELPADERPREKMWKHGAPALTDAELIAVILRTGVVGTNAVELARELLEQYGSLNALSRATAKELCAFKGIKEAKALQMVAAFGLGQRLANERFCKVKIDAPELVYDLLSPEMRTLRKESLRVILLDTRYHLLKVEEVSLGSINESIAHPREIFQPAIQFSAYAVILVHNHPSGDPSPSQADITLTRRIAEAGELLKIPLLDHVILGSPETTALPYYSFKESGLL